MSNNRILKVAEVAKWLRISRKNVYDLLKEGKIYFVRSGRKYLIPERAVEDFLMGGQDYKKSA